jgi:hypothetical protein
MVIFVGGGLGVGFVLGVVDYLGRDPESVVRVDEVADVLEESDAGHRLEGHADEILARYLPRAQTLPEAEHVRGRVVPLSRLPPEFQGLGGDFGAPELLLRTPEGDTPPAVLLSWGHMRHGIIVFAAAPREEPRGFYTRKVGDRTFVVANES